MGFPPGGVGHSRVLDHLEGEIEAVNFSCESHGIYCVCWWKLWRCWCLKQENPWETISFFFGFSHNEIPGRNPAEIRWQFSQESQLVARGGSLAWICRYMLIRYDSVWCQYFNVPLHGIYTVMYRRSISMLDMMWWFNHKLFCCLKSVSFSPYDGWFQWKIRVWLKIGSPLNPLSHH